MKGTQECPSPTPRQQPGGTERYRQEMIAQGSKFITNFSFSWAPVPKSNECSGKLSGSTLPKGVFFFLPESLKQSLTTHWLATARTGEDSANDSFA